MQPLVAQSISRSTNMESKGNFSTSALLFSLSFNLILTFCSFGFTCYSLHRLDSRLTTVEQDWLVINHPYQFANRLVVKPTSTPSPPSGSRRKGAFAKRAMDRPTMCRKCSSPCSNVNRPLKVSCFSLHVVIKIAIQIQMIYSFGKPSVGETVLQTLITELLNGLFLELKRMLK